VNGVPSAWAKCTLFRGMMASSSALRVSTILKVELSITNLDLREWCTVLGLHSLGNPLKNLGFLELPVDVFNSSLSVCIFGRHPLSQSGFKFMQKRFARRRDGSIEGIFGQQCGHFSIC
jgi:hypothetical protein